MSTTGPTRIPRLAPRDRTPSLSGWGGPAPLDSPSESATSTSSIPSPALYPESSAPRSRRVKQPSSSRLEDSFQKYLVLVIPPSVLPSSPPSSQVSSYANGYGRFEQGILLRLQTSMTLQLASIIKEYSLSSSKGVGLYLCLGSRTMRITEDAWSIIFSAHLSGKGHPLDAFAPFPIVAQIEFDIDPRRATWFHDFKTPATLPPAYITPQTRSIPYSHSTHPSLNTLESADSPPAALLRSAQPDSGRRPLSLVNRQLTYRRPRTMTTMGLASPLLTDEMSQVGPHKVLTPRVVELERRAPWIDMWRLGRYPHLELYPAVYPHHSLYPPAVASKIKLPHRLPAPLILLPHTAYEPLSALPSPDPFLDPPSRDTRSGSLSIYSEVSTASLAARTGGRFDLERLREFRLAGSSASATFDLESEGSQFEGYALASGLNQGI